MRQAIVIREKTIRETRAVAGVDSRTWRNLEIDAAGLAAELQKRIRGEVRFDDGSRALYATDGSNYRQPPIGVVIPKDIDDVLLTVDTCRRFEAPVLARGGGTSLAGQCCNIAVVIDMSKYLHGIVDLDPDRRIARVEPGCVLDDLRSAAEQFHLTFAPDPSTHNHNTLGGMIGNNSCGVHSVMAGETLQNIDELEILTYDGLRMRVGKTSDEELERIIRFGGPRGEIYRRLKELRDRYADLIRSRFPRIPRRVSGYNLPDLLPENGFNVAKALVGSEGTCVIILEALTRLVYSPPFRSLLVLGCPDVYEAGDHVPEVLAARPVGLEGVDDRLISDMTKKGLHPEGVRILPSGKGWLVVEFGGDSKKEADDRAKELMESLRKKSNPPDMKLFDDRREEEIIWKVRESGLGATARVPGQKADSWEGWEDSSVAPEKLGGYLRELRRLFERYGYHCSLYGHFGQGCVHTRIDFDLYTQPGIDTYRSFMYEAADLVLSLGGSLSGEHGDGQSRAELLPKMFGPELIEAFREFKSIWDPAWRMNPGKLVDPYRMDENLRLGTGYSPPAWKTSFQYPDDMNSFTYAILRCVGVGDCRKEHTGTMCPSYMGTREEMWSTRGHARLLWEAMNKGEVISGWKEKSVKEALDYCLSCKACKGECPMNVDMATYKAEYFSHYYKGRLRPLDAYSMGLIYWWSRLAGHIPDVANFFMQNRPFSTLLKIAGGIAPTRGFPLYAKQTFKDWFFKRGVHNAGSPKVILWADTFNNYFFPETAIAAVEVIESLGYQVYVARRSLCCGRPLFDFGMLELAKRLHRQILGALHPLLEEGVPLVGLEPACLVTFRDELINLFPHDMAARRLSERSFLLSEFLEKEVGITPFQGLTEKL
jgi:FAD/FMN-containing dehydrogenase/Fe-S oxidoreductase